MKKQKWELPAFKDLTEDDIEQGNFLILMSVYSGFEMEWHKNKIGSPIILGHFFNPYYSSSWLGMRQMKFHESFDWLIPIIREAKKRHYFEGYTGMVIMQELACLNVKNCWKAVVEHLRWIYQNKEIRDEVFTYRIIQKKGIHIHSLSPQPGIGANLP